MFPELSISDYVTIRFYSLILFDYNFLVLKVPPHIYFYLHPLYSLSIEFYLAESYMCLFFYILFKILLVVGEVILLASLDFKGSLSRILFLLINHTGDVSGH